MKIIKKWLKSSVSSWGFGFFRVMGKAPYPRMAIVDPSNFCNLKCALCPTGRGILKCRQQFMSLEIFQRILDQIPTLKHISLFNWGEPFLNPHIFEMIRLAEGKSIAISLHSNFSFSKLNEFFTEIVESGLESLEISLDGSNQEDYEKYRQGGSFALVLENIKKLIEIKKKTGKKNPKIIWKFIVSRYNEKNIGKAQKLATDLGVNFVLAEIGLGDNLPDIVFPENLEERRRWLPEEKNHIRSEYQGEYKKPLNDKRCDFLFSSVTIGPDGKIYPCCFVCDEKNAFGDLTREKFADIWNNEKYTAAGNLFVKNGKTKKQSADCL